MALTAIAVVGVVYAVYGSLPLAEPDEARYAEVAREMLETGDWITPQLNYQPFLDKPPLLYWLSASAFRIFGLNEMAARLPVMVAAVVGLWIAFALARAMYGETTAALAATILATSPLYFGMGQILTMDMLLTTCTLVALQAAWCGFQQADRDWYRVAYAATAFGILAKGPIAAVIVTVPLATVLLRYADKRQRRLALDVPGLLLMAAIVAPWFLAVETSNRGFLSSFLFHHHIDRFFNPWHHREPLWFYLYVLPIALFPWSLLWLLDARSVRFRMAEWSAATTYLAAWAASTVVLLSLSRSKLIPYVLPALPALAILLARMYEHLLEHRSGRLMERAPMALALAAEVLVLVAGAFWNLTHSPRLPQLAPLLALSAVLLLCEAWLLGRWLSAGTHHAAFGTLVAAALGLLMIAEHGRDLARSYTRLGSAAAAVAAPGDQLVILGSYMPAVGFHLHRKALVVAGDDVAQLSDLWGSGRTVILVTSRGRLSAIAKVTGAMPTIVAEEGDKVLTSNRRPVPLRSSLAVLR